jgi:hypothetical protein
MTLAIAVAALLAATLFYTLFVRAKDIPPPDPVSPTQHLDERRAAIYENLRDLQFEYRVGKLSDADYAQTKLSLQKELAVVMAETERIVKGGAVAKAGASSKPTKTASAPLLKSELAAVAVGLTCPHCGAEFPVPMKFCGSCGKAMGEEEAL